MNINRNMVQWLIIGLLAIACFYFWRKASITQEGLLGEDVGFQKNERQYVEISTDKSMSDLKKENKVLYDSIGKLNNIKEAIQIKYVTQYHSDTVFVDTNHGVDMDSIYTFKQKSDSITYTLDIKGKHVEWFKLSLTLEDSLTLVTRSLNGLNETMITHTPHTKIEDVTIFTPKPKPTERLKDKVYIGVGAGVGYGLINQKPDIFIGVNIGFKF